MAKQLHQINAFNAGELSPLLEARIDFGNRSKGAAEITNFFPIKQGPLTYRAGSKYLARTKLDNSDGTARAELIPFQYSSTDTAMIECGANYFRFFKDKTLQTRTGVALTSISNASQAVVTMPVHASLAGVNGAVAGSPCVVTTSAAHNLNTGELVWIENVTPGGAGNQVEEDIECVASATIANQLGPWRVVVTSSTTFELWEKDFKKAVWADGTTATAGDVYKVFDDGDLIYISGVAGNATVSTGVNGNYYRVENYQNTTTAPYVFKLKNLDGTAVDFSAAAGNGTGGTAAWHGACHDYTQAQLFDSAGIFQLSYEGAGDVIFMAHESHYPKKLTRYGHKAWNWSSIGYNQVTVKASGVINATDPYVEAGPWGEKQEGNIENKGVANTGGFGSNMSAVGDTGNFKFKKSTIQDSDVGRLMRFGSNTNWGYGIITAVVSGKEATVRIIERPPGGTSNVRSWYLGAWSETTGYPDVVCLHQGRLVFAKDNAMYFSAADAYNDFAPNTFDYTDGIDAYTTDVADDRAITVSMQSSEKIKWMKSMEHGLVVGTTGGEYVVSPSDEGGAITPTDISQTKPTSVGSRVKQAMNVDGNVLFIQSSLRKAREFTHKDNYSCNDLNLLSEHITNGGITRMVYQQEPWSLVWAMNEGDGSLLSMVYDREQEVVGWSTHAIEGTPITGETAVIVESIACLPAADANRDELWMICRRKIGSTDVRYIEYLGQDWLFDTTIAESAFCGLDCSITVSGSSATITGLSHLEGETVDVVVDGAAHPAKTVASGQITLNYAPVSTTHVGYKYTGVWESQDVDTNNRYGIPDIPMNKRINKVTLLLNQTSGLWCGPSSTEMDEIPFRTTSMDMQAAVPLFDGLKEIAFRGNNQKRTRIRLEQRSPLPCTICAIYPDIENQPGR